MKATAKHSLIWAERIMQGGAIWQCSLQTVEKRAVWSKEIRQWEVKDKFLEERLGWSEESGSYI